MAPLSLCMIVRDESEVLARCLASVVGVADEIIVVDTGSSDDTVEIAHSFGAKIDYFEWIDDFAAARNYSFELATHPYIFWLDADDIVLPEDREKLLALKSRLEKDAYWMRYDYAQNAFGESTCLLHRERIVRNTPQIRWLYPAHTILSLGPETTSEVVDITISHRRTPAGIAMDHGRGLRILQRALENPEYARVPRIHYYLARELRAVGRLAEAAKEYERFLAMPAAWSGYHSSAQEELATCRRRLALEDTPRAAEHHRYARLAALGARRLDPTRAEPYFLLGQLAEDEGKLAKAVFWYERALRPVPDTTCQIAPQAYRLGPAIRLCHLWQQLGDLAKADHYNELALGWSPRDPLLHMTRRKLRGRAGAAPAADLQAGADRPLVAICAQQTFEPWNGETPDTEGIGGSQTGAVRLAEELARIGHRVAVFCPCAGREGTLGGVDYFDLSRFPDFAATHFLDVFIALRHATLLELPVRAARRYLWIKDAHALQARNADGDLVHRHYDRLDAVLCVSPWQRDEFARYHGVPAEKIVVTRNGIDPERFSSRVRRQRHRFIYSSDPQRGLDTLLDLFPRIRERLPDAELHVFYGFDNWNRSLLASLFDPEERARRNSIRAQLAQPGVTWHGRVGQTQLALEMLRSDIWFYPTRCSETYCITALEAQMAGAVCVCSDLAALQTTVGDRGILIPGDAYTEEYRQRALAEVFAILQDRERRRRLTAKARRWAAQQTWSGLAKEWMKLFETGPA